jgi:signal transduction histidine kinase
MSTRLGRTAMPPCAAIAMLVTSLTTVAFAADVRPIAELKSLPEAELAAGLPVAIRGVVTWRDESGRMMFVQDTTGGIFGLMPRDSGAQPLPDDAPVATEIEAEGVISRGGFAPSLRLTSLRPVGPAPLPEPQPFDDVRFFTGADEGALVEVTGIVRGVREERFMWRLIVSHELRRFEVQCRKAAMPADFGTWCQSLIDGEVRLLAVSATKFNVRGEMFEPRLLVSRADWIAPLAPSDGSPFDAPKIAIDAVARYRAAPLDNHMLRTEGTVVHSLPGEALFLQEGQHGLRVLTQSAETFTPGDRVEVAGFAERGGTVAGLTEAVVRRVGHGLPPEPFDIQPDDIAAIHARSADSFTIAEPGDYEGCLVRFPALLLERASFRGGDLLVLAAGKTSVTVRVSTADVETLQGLEVGSRLLVAGILHVIPASEPLPWPLTAPTRMEIDPRSAADITILARPPWWTPRRLMLLLGAIAATLAVSVGWAVALRGQVRRQMREIEAGLRAEAVAEERERIAREFHDTLEQGLAALGLRLGVAASRTRDEEARGVLRQQKTLLSWLQAQTREFLWDLRDTSHAEEPFDATLAGHVEQLRSLCPVPIDLEIAAEDLPEIAAPLQHDLIRIVREAVHNAARHADPTRVLVRARNVAGRLEVEVADDGGGFDVAARAVSPGHYGIRGMRERARRLGAEMAIESGARGGTVVRVSLPAAPPVSTIAGPPVAVG